MAWWPSGADRRADQSRLTGKLPRILQADTWTTWRKFGGEVYRDLERHPLVECSERRLMAEERVAQEPTEH